MDQQNEGLDESSVPAVSSLRSRFESLARPSPARPPLKSKPSGSASHGLAPAIPTKPQSHNLRPKSMIEYEDQRGDLVDSRASFENRERLGTQSQTEQTASTAKVNETNNTARAAARPQIPLKKPALLAKYSEAAGIQAPLLETKNHDSDRNVEVSSPQMESLKQRGRVSSDASWVERVRAGSDASSHVASPINGRTSPKKFTRPSRVDSNASWVESLTLQDTSDIEEEELEETPPLPPRTSLQEVRREDYSLVGATRGQAPAPKPILPTRTSSLAPSIHLPSKPRPGMSQSLDRPAVYGSVSSAASSTASLSAPPAVPPPRRSLDRRREITPEFSNDALLPLTKVSAQLERSPVTPALSRSATVSRPNDSPSLRPITRASTFAGSEADVSLSEKEQESSALPFPDISRANRRAPTWRSRPSQIHTEYDTRLLAVSKDLVCTTGFITRVWNHKTGELLVNIAHPEAVKITAVRFKPERRNAGPSLWLGTSLGDMHEVDVQDQRIVDTSQRAHKGREVIKIFGDTSDLWSLDDSGNLAVWQKDSKGSPSLQSQFGMFHVQRGHTASMLCDGKLWIATGKEVRVYLPTARSEADFSIGKASLQQLNIGDITSVAALPSRSDVLFFGHTDGKISVWCRQSLRCISTVHISLNKVSHLYGVGHHLWAGYGSGTIQAYDVSSSAWNTKKEWQAHSKQISGIACDTSSEDPYKVISLGADNALKCWDGLFEDDWLEDRVHSYDSSYCSFDEIGVSVLTWNAGAAKPSHLQHRIDDDSFLRDYIGSNAAADILVFGFQELVDLEDKKLTAKSFFKSKKKDAFEQEHMTHQYKAWRDHLTLRIQEYTSEDYVNLHTASMIGLFTCIFVKATIRPRIKHVHQAEVKRGMGGHYGNKGALVLRLVLDDSSICFVNCHLAAGQTQTANRNSDAAAILEAECLPPWPLNPQAAAEHADVFPAGGDGSSVLDHELCILNGDLNYRIDTMSRDTVIKYVQQKNLARLLERDQLLLSRKKNPGFRLRAFQEKAIQFSPTYKYNVNSDEFDTSEKKRSPAWCDRVLFRGLGKIKCDQYRRWEVRVSDHRPVSASLMLRVKTVDPYLRASVMEQCVKDLKAYRLEAVRLTQRET